jgi:hypothetical protein
MLRRRFMLARMVRAARMGRANILSINGARARPKNTKIVAFGSTSISQTPYFQAFAVRPAFPNDRILYLKIVFAELTKIRSTRLRFSSTAQVRTRASHGFTTCTAKS